MADLQDAFAGRTDEMLDMLRQMVEIESPSTDKAACDRMGNFVSQVARDLGAEVTVIPQEAHGDHLVARWDQGPGFLLLAHLDTVWPLGTLEQRPWRVEDGRAYGPGCYDNKASAVIVLTALKGLHELGMAPNRPVTVIFNSDEEIGSDTSRALIKTEGQKAEMVFCMEPARPDGSLKVWRKGTGRYVVRTFGHAVHAGGDHEKGINAVEEMAHQILRLQAMTDYERGSTVSVGKVMGGTRSNVVPDRAKAYVDLRVMTAAEGERMNAAIHGLQPAVEGAQVAVEGGLSRPPMEQSPLTMEPFRRTQEIAATLGLTLTASGTGGASDGNFTAAVGTPTLDGLGAVGDGAHSVDEHVVVSSLAERAALMAALLARW
jgi:glutamate carboxypeptidase